MLKVNHTAYYARLKEFMKGKKLPEGYTHQIHKNIFEEKIFSNHGKNIGQQIAVKKILSMPEAYILHGEEIAFIISISEYSASFIVIGESNQDNVITFEDAIKTGLNYEKMGY